MIPKYINELQQKGLKLNSFKNVWQQIHLHATIAIVKTQ